MAAPTPAELAGLSSPRGRGGAPTPADLAGLTGGSGTRRRRRRDDEDGGILGTISRIPGDFVEGGYRAAVNMPASLYYSADAIADDIRAAAQEGLGPLTGSDDPGLRSDYSFRGTRRLGDELVRGTVQTVQHPLRDPFQTTMLGLGTASLVAGTGARVSAAASAPGRAATARALVTTPQGRPRTLRLGDLEVHPETSRSALGRTVQYGHDKLLQSGDPGTVRARLLNRKIGKINVQEARAAERIARGNAEALIAMGRKLSDGEQKALQVVAETAPWSGLVTAASARVTGARDGAARKRHQAELDLLHAARDHLDDLDGTPTFAADQAKLVRVYERMGKVAGDRETLLKALAMLTDESIARRHRDAARVGLGAHYERPTPEKLGISADLDRKQARVDRLQGLHDRAIVMRDKDADALIAKLTREEMRRQAKTPDAPPAAPLERAPAKPPAKAAAAAGVTIVPSKKPDTPAAPEPETPMDPRWARLEQLEKAHDKQLNKLRLALFGKADMTEVRFRSGMNKKASDQAAGVDKSGRRSGQSGWKATKRQKVVDEQKQRAEMWMEEQMAKLPDDHPLRVAWERRVAEMDALRKELSPDPEDVFGSGPAKFAAAPEAQKRPEELHESLEEHESGQVRLTTEGEQVSLLGLPDRGIPNEVPDRTVDELAAATREAKKEQPAPKPELSGEGAGVYRVTFKDGTTVGRAANSPEGALRTLTASERARVAKIEKGYEPAKPAPAKPEPKKAAPPKSTKPTKSTRPGVKPVRIGGRVVTAGAVLTPRHGVRADRLGAALSLAKEELASTRARVAKKKQPTGILGHEDFEPGPAAIRIPDVATRRGQRTLHRMGKVGAQGTVGNLTPPGSVTHGYTGVLREHALRRQDTTRLVGESALEASKYAGLLHIHELVRLAVQPHPTRPDDIAVRLDGIGKGERLPLDVRRFLDDPEDFFRTAHPDEATIKYEQIKAKLFMNPHRLDPDARAEFNRLLEEGKIGWVPKAILGDFAKAKAPLSSTIGRRPAAFVDLVNNASRFAILYLKPAYAIPNLLGNLALNLIQQGFAAPRNLAWAVRLEHRLGPDGAARVDAALGEGVYTSLAAQGAGRMARVTDAAARQWSKIIDRPFRRAAFYHEARRAGYKTDADILRLLDDPHNPDLMQVTLKANREIIDYSNLSHTEREIIRRVVFFYPWVKGSTVYAGRIVREHPAQAAVYGTLGAYGAAETDRRIGPRPAYLEGTFPVGDRLVNPMAAALFQTPAQAALGIAGIVTGNRSSAAEPNDFDTPALRLALALRSKEDWRGIPYPEDTPAHAIATDTLFNSLPQVRAVKTAMDARAGRGQDRLYPPSLENALSQFGVGGIYPRKYNQAELRRQARREAR